ncbi:spirocyclase AveC family protein [Streptomyces alanosinicus]|uniref:Spirocyclase, AveC family n=1 Tax=Streptomyces alanosinicus TaxID=68171 RepID=A0A919D882_9ACTN|nr:spirocyclase AveC family protein [Streptomyces alanosinicus]GHE14672.1 hypothetical protein GCM10010339_86250 [Streptomyces alanosinicus]
MNPHRTDQIDAPASRTRPRRGTRLSPAAAWATTGTAFLAVQTWVIVRWLADGDVSPTRPPEYGLSPARQAVFTTGEVAVVLAVIVCAWWIIRDLRRKGQVTIHAALFIGYGSAHWMDPVMNYRHWGFANTNATLHVTSWAPYLPGWSGPERLPQPLIFATGLFFPLLILWIWLALGLAHKLAALRPHWGRLRLAAALLPPVMALDAIAESLLIHVGAFAYVGASPRYSLFGGHWYQLPLAEPLLCSVLFVLPTALLIVTAQTQGREVPLFSGTQHMAGTRRVWMRLLSGIGFTHMTLLLWLVAISFFLQHPTIPQDTPPFLRM